MDVSIQIYRDGYEAAYKVQRKDLHGLEVFGPWPLVVVKTTDFDCGECGGWPLWEDAVVMNEFEEPGLQRSLVALWNDLQGARE